MRKLLIIAVVVLALFLGCGANENVINITSIDPNDGVIGGVQQLFNIEVEYTLSTDESGYIWIGFNTESHNPNSYPTYESYKIKKGSGKVIFNGIVVPTNSSFYVLASLSAHNDGRLGDMVSDKKLIIK